FSFRGCYTILKYEFKELLFSQFLIFDFQLFAQGLKSLLLFVQILFIASQFLNFFSRSIKSLCPSKAFRADTIVQTARSCGSIEIVTSAQLTMHLLGQFGIISFDEFVQSAQIAVTPFCNPTLQRLLLAVALRFRKALIDFKK